MIWRYPNFRKPPNRLKHQSFRERQLLEEADVFAVRRLLVCRVFHVLQTVACHPDSTSKCTEISHISIPLRWVRTIISINLYKSFEPICPSVHISFMMLLDEHILYIFIYWTLSDNMLRLAGKIIHPCWWLDGPLIHWRHISIPCEVWSIMIQQFSLAIDTPCDFPVER